MGSAMQFQPLVRILNEGKITMDTVKDEWGGAPGSNNAKTLAQFTEFWTRVELLSADSSEASQLEDVSLTTEVE